MKNILRGYGFMLSAVAVLAGFVFSMAHWPVLTLGVVALGVLTAIAHEIGSIE